MRALVTGANGFLGSHLVDLLLEDRDWEVRALVRGHSDLRWLEGKPIEKVIGDVTLPPEKLYAAVREVDVVFHLAGATKALRNKTFYLVNQDGAENLIHACLSQPAPPRRLVLISSADAIGPSLTDEPLNEETEPRPVTHYGRSKLRAERVARVYMDRLSITILRPGAIYGPRDMELLPLFKAVRRGLAPRFGVSPRHFNLAHCRDVARAIILAGRVEAAGSEDFMVGGFNTTPTRLMEVIAKVLGKRKLLSVAIPKPLVWVAAMASSAVGALSRRPRIFTYGNIRRLIAKNWTLDLLKAQHILGYQPSIDLVAGVEETIGWYRSHSLL